MPETTEEPAAITRARHLLREWDAIACVIPFPNTQLILIDHLPILESFEPKLRAMNADFRSFLEQRMADIKHDFEHWDAMAGHTAEAHKANKALGDTIRDLCMERETMRATIHGLADALEKWAEIYPESVDCDFENLVRVARAVAKGEKTDAAS